MRLSLQNLAVAKTNNLQPYLFRVLQEQGAGAEVDLTIHVSSGAGIPRMFSTGGSSEAFDQLGIAVTWEKG